MAKHLTFDIVFYSFLCSGIALQHSIKLFSAITLVMETSNTKRIQKITLSRQAMISKNVIQNIQYISKIQGHVNYIRKNRYSQIKAIFCHTHMNNS